MNAPRKFRKKPVVIEAIQFLEAGSLSGFKSNRVEVAAFLGKAGHYDFDTGSFLISTLEGTMQAVWDDWIIKGVKGEFYPCKPDIFEATYEEVDAATEELVVCCQDNCTKPAEYRVFWPGQ